MQLTFAVSKLGKRVGKKTVWNEREARWEPMEHSLRGQSEFFVYVAEADEDTIENRAAMREMIAAEPTFCVFLGMPNTHQVKMERVQEGNLLRFGLMERKKDNFDDVPRSWLTVDVDGLEMPHSVLEHDDRLEDMFFAVLEDAGLDFLIADCVIHLSSSHGVADDDRMRAHVEWQLTRPLCLYEMCAVASHINAAFAKAGYPADILDLKIYESSRLLFTSEPYFCSMDDTPVAGPRVKRVRIARRGRKRVRIPFEWTQGLAPPVCETADPGGQTIVDAEFRPGNVNNAFTQMLARHARKWHPSKCTEEEAFAAAAAECEAAIRGIEGATDAKTIERLLEFRSVSRQSWGRFLAKLKEERYGKLTEFVVEQGATPTLDQTREMLKDAIAKALAEGMELKYKRERGETSVLPPKCTIIKAPPGTGKTNALAFAIKELELIDKMSIDVRTPTVSLSTEVYNKAAGLLHGNIRLFRGIEQHCHDEMKEAREKLKKVGVSPRRTLCETCKFNVRNGGTCEWPVETPETKPGMRIGQHAHYHSVISHITADKSDRIADIYIIDESALEALGPERDEGHLEALSEIADKPVLRAIDGKEDWSGTVDTIQNRKAVLGALRRLSGHIADPEYFGDEKFIDEFLAGEERIVRQYGIRLSDMAKKAGFDPDLPKVKDTYAIKRSAELLLLVGRAIKLSLRDGSAHVAGLRKHDNGHIEVELKRELPMALKERPIIVLDATASEGWLEKTIFGDTHVVARNDFRVVAHHAHLTQYVDKSFSKNYIIGGLKHNKKKDTKALQHLVYDVLANARKYKDVLVVAQLDVKEAIKRSVNNRANPPTNVSYLHYKALKGINEFENVRCAMIIGRFQPPPYAIEATAEGLSAGTGVAVRKLPDNAPIPRVRDHRLIHADAGVKWLSVQHERHPDPQCEMIRYQHADAEVIQAVGRVRPLQRTSDNPVHITVYGTTDTGLIINETPHWGDRVVGGIGVHYAHLVEQAGIAYQLDSPFQLAQFGGTAGDLGNNTRREATKLHQRRDWTTWLLDYYGSTYKASISNSIHPDQTPQFVKDIIEADTGLTLQRLPRPPHRRN